MLWKSDIQDLVSIKKDENESSLYMWYKLSFKLIFQDNSPIYPIDSREHSWCMLLWVHILYDLLTLISQCFHFFLGQEIFNDKKAISTKLSRKHKNIQNGKRRILWKVLTCLTVENTVGTCSLMFMSSTIWWHCLRRVATSSASKKLS